MAAHAGEEARKTGDFKCKGCDETIHVKRGDPIPECKCGSEEFDERVNEPSNPITRKKGK
jgi:hypothetical protein